jgi:hypothetical protein
MITCVKFQISFFDLKVKKYIFLFNSNFSTGTMIDILTTRFHDAYSYLVTENGNLINDQPIKQRNDDYKQHKSVITTALKDDDQSIVIN